MHGISDRIKEKHARLSGENTSITEEKKSNEPPYLAAARRGRPNLTIISPFGSVITTADTGDRIKSPLSQPSPSNGGGNQTNIKRTSSNLAKLVDYDDELEFNMETRGKEANFMLEGKVKFYVSNTLDIQMKKRKLDEMNNLKLVNKDTSE